jgi:16S rRNA (cytosine967-C5)-methyltransferase
VEQARKLLQKNEIPFREIPALGCFETTSAVLAANKLDGLPGFYLQNTGSQAVALLAAAYAKKTVCDVTAAPGGKSMTLACLRPDLTIHASDIHEGRLRLLQNNLARLALKNIQAFTADIFNYPPGRETADLVILDAPCSSSGTLRKNPDLKSKIGKNMIKKNANCQQWMLERVFAIFPRATVIYAVCSFIHEESEGLVEKVAAKLNLQAAAIAPLLEKYAFRVEAKKFGCYLLPSALNNDLFYIALLKRKPETAGRKNNI